MNDELQHSASQQETPPVLQVSASLSTQPPKSNKTVWIIVGIAVVVLCLCSIACVALFGTSMYKVYTEKAPIELVLDNYMQYMENKDAKSAYALLSPRAQRQIPILEVENLLEGNNYVLFEGYQSLTVTNLNISASANANPDLPQGTVANVTGIIIFEGNIQGSFDGILEKVDGAWMIDYMYVTVPPDKIK